MQFPHFAGFFCDYLDQFSNILSQDFIFILVVLILLGTSFCRKITLVAVLLKMITMSFAFDDYFVFQGK